MKKRKRKKKRSRKTWRIGKFVISPKAQLTICAAASVMLISTVCFFFVVLGSYDGLGLPKEIGYNQYDLSGFYEEDGFLHYEDETYTSLVGIDVSYYQEDIDWQKVADSGVDFAMIRLGFRGYDNGELAIDDRYRENLRGARSAGLDVGVYFFSQAVTVEEAVEEARFVVRHIRGKGVDMPVVFDMEPIEGADRITDLTDMERTEIADAFCQIIEKNGYRPMVYGNPHWLYNYIDLSYLTRYDTWLAHYGTETDYPYSFRMWQYTDSGYVDGISGGVDLNVYLIEK